MFKSELDAARMQQASPILQTLSIFCTLLAALQSMKADLETEMERRTCRLAGSCGGTFLTGLQPLNIRCVIERSTLLAPVQDLLCFINMSTGHNPKRDQLLLNQSK